MNLDKLPKQIRLFKTDAHPCSYISGEQASTVFVDPLQAPTKALNSHLHQLGFRRSGSHLYRPNCENCQACLSCRVLVADFKFKRQHNKIWNRNSSLEVIEVTSLDIDECYPLYNDYINMRHSDGDMYPATPKQFKDFIQEVAEGTQYFKFYNEGKLVAVSVTDFLNQGLSAVYTFFDPALSKRSLGSFIILWQIEKARQLKLPYLFLGYWIKSCQKMSYKSSYRPLELLIDNSWVLLK